MPVFDFDGEEEDEDEQLRQDFEAVSVFEMELAQQEQEERVRRESSPWDEAVHDLPDGTPVKLPLQALAEAIHLRDTENLRDALQALGSCLRDAAQKDVAVDANVVGGLELGMRQFREDPHAIEWCAFCISRLAHGGDRKSSDRRVAIFGGDAHGAVIRAIHTHKSNPDVLEQCLMATRNLVMASSQDALAHSAKASLAAGGCLEACLVALENHMSRKSVVIHAVATIVNLALSAGPVVVNEENARAIADGRAHVALHSVSEHYKCSSGGSGGGSAIGSWLPPCIATIAAKKT